MELQEKINQLEDILELDQGTLEVATRLDSLEEWDSVAAISLMALVDEKFDKQLTSNEIKNFKTIGDILKAME